MRRSCVSDGKATHGQFVSRFDGKVSPARESERGHGFAEEDPGSPSTEARDWLKAGEKFARSLMRPGKLPFDLVRESVDPGVRPTLR